MTSRKETRPKKKTKPAPQTEPTPEPAPTNPNEARGPRVKMITIEIPIIEGGKPSDSALLAPCKLGGGLLQAHHAEAMRRAHQGLIAIGAITADGRYVLNPMDTLRTLLDRLGHAIAAADAG